MGELSRQARPGGSTAPSFFYGIGTLQFVEALQQGYIDLHKDYVHNYPGSPVNTIYLTPVVPGGADAVTVCAHLNSVQEHGRRLFGFDYDFTKVDYLIRGAYEHSSQPGRPRQLRRSLYEFRKLCSLNGIETGRILRMLYAVKLTFRGFILEFRSDIINRLIVSREAELYRGSEYRFKFMSHRVPFNSVLSYTGVGVLEKSFTRNYYALLDDYREKARLMSTDAAAGSEGNRLALAKKEALSSFYLGQANLIKELEENIYRRQMVKYS